MTPMVSVIIPALDAELTIARALETALASEIPIEVLVVDDGSRDATMDVVRSYEDERIRLLSTGKRHSGASHARNIAIDAAEGDWVALLDADDYWKPGRLRFLLEAANNMSADLVADNISVYHTDNPTSGTQTLLGQRRIRLQRPIVMSPAMFVREDLGLLQPVVARSVLNEHRIRFSARGRSAEDFAFVYDCLQYANRAVLVPEAMYVYVKDPTHTSLSSASPDFWLDSLCVTSELLTRAPRPSAEVQKLLSRRLQRVWTNYVYLSARREAASGQLLTAVAKILRNPDALGLGFRTLTRRRSLRANRSHPPVRDLP